ncbi:MAG: hypothetical protein KY432_00165 [Acidobacteria bacterium]|nr:hypothetical protein [Acidobacteriota bacterium]
MSSIRQALLFHIYSGDLVFTAAALLALAVVLDLSVRRSGNELVRRTARILFLLSLPLGALATVPVPLWIAVPLVGAWGGYAVIGFGRGSKRKAAISGVIVLILAAASLVPELWWRLRKPPQTSLPATLFVFGDSLSSGGFGESRTWVDRLDETTEPSFINLSRPSDTTESVLRYQISELDTRACRSCGVLIELGGNEMLGDGSAREYARNLRTLIEESRNRGAEIVWLVELPPLPLRWSWAAVQRRTARDTGTILIPRRVLASVLVEEANTYDGLHLTDRGHEELARKMSVWLGLGNDMNSRTKRLRPALHELSPFEHELSLRNHEPSDPKHERPPSSMNSGRARGSREPNAARTSVSTEPDPPKSPNPIRDIRFSLSLPLPSSRPSASERRDLPNGLKCWPLARSNFARQQIRNMTRWPSAFDA